ncbi:MAG: hypothetical protein J0H08_15225, partial [Rhizobiales bacterium]|nr:hypothetical protein [Hyphomicrobiales bacterium]
RRASGILSRSLADAGAETLVVLTTDRAPAGAARHPASRASGRVADPAYAAAGDIAYDVALDVPLGTALAGEGLRCHAPEQGEPFRAPRAAAALAVLRLGLPVVAVDVSGLSPSAASRVGEEVRRSAGVLGRRVAVLALTGLSGSAIPPDLNADPGSIASAEYDAASRQVLGWLQAGDADAIERAIPGLAGIANIESDGSVLAALAGAVRGPWRGAEILTYAAIFGAGAAVVDLRLDTVSGVRS